jgi:type IV pilus assembly protein PilV
MNNMKKRNQEGFTLIEVLIAVVVFSFGLLGVAGIMTVSVKNNHNGYMRSQATFLASSIIDTMRKNQLELWGGGFDGTYTGYADTSSMCTAVGGCASADFALRDLQHWSNLVTQLLPNSKGEIACDSTVDPISDIPVMIDNPSAPGTEMICEHCAIEPYNGFCKVTITWDESNNTNGNSTQTLELIGKP